MVFEKTLVTMVKGIRAARGKEDEYIQDAIQEIKDELKSDSLRVKSCAISKLAYLNMLGYDILWASMSIVDVITRADKMSIRRPGYLAASICFQEKNDLGLMLTNHFRKELMSGNRSQIEMGIALSNLACICTSDMSRELIGDLVSLLGSNKPYVRKKVVLCMFRLFLRYPIGLRSAFPKLKDRLTDEDQGVLTACVNTFLELARKNARNYLILVPHFFTLLTQTSNNWLMIKLLKLFAQLCPLEQRLASKLGDPLLQILNTTHAKSVEFEAIRTLVRIFPGNHEHVQPALAKLRPFLFSADRNLRYLGLEVVEELIRLNPVLHETRELPLYPDLHEKILEAIEEVDTTIRTVALSILDKIVDKASFPKIAEKLLSMSQRWGSSDEYIKTLLSMGESDTYELIEDFGWYLLTLAEIAKNKHSSHAQKVADQYIDIVSRVPAVRGYAVSVAKILLCGENHESDQLNISLDGNPNNTNNNTNNNICAPSCAAPIISTLAFVIGEYHSHFEDLTSYEPLCSLLLSAASSNSEHLTVMCRTICLWNAVKLFCGYSVRMEKNSKGTMMTVEGSEAVVDTTRESLSVIYNRVRDEFLQKLPELVLSQDVEVSERATLSYYIMQWAKDRSQLSGFYPDQEEVPLEVLGLEEQDKVPLPEGIDLDTPFYDIPPEPVQSDTEIQQENNRLLLGQAYTAEELRILNGGNVNNISSGKSEHQNSLFMLKTKQDGLMVSNEGSGMMGSSSDNTNSPSKITPPVVPLDPLEAMKQKLAAQKQSYQVIKKDDGGKSGKQSVLNPHSAGFGASAKPHQGGALPNSAGQVTSAISGGAAASPIITMSSNNTTSFWRSGGNVVVPPTPPNWLAIPSEKEMQDLLGKKWSVWSKDENITVWICYKNKKGSQFRVDFRVEKNDATTSTTAVNNNTSNGGSSDTCSSTGVVIQDIKIKTSSGFLEGNSTDLITGEMKDPRSGKIKTSWSIASIEKPSSSGGKSPTSTKSPTTTTIDISNTENSLENPLEIPCEIIYELITTNMSASATSSSSADTMTIISSQAPSSASSFVDVSTEKPPAVDLLDEPAVVSDESTSSKQGNAVVTAAVKSVTETTSSSPGVSPKPVTTGDSATATKLLANPPGVPSGFPVQTKTSKSIPVTLALPVSASLNPRRWTEDEIASYITGNSKTHLLFQAADVTNFAVSSLVCTDPIAVTETFLPALVSKLACITGFHALSQGAQGGATIVPGQPKKFLLISQTNVNFANGAGLSAPHLVALCAGAVKEDQLMIRVTVKGDAADVAETVKEELIANIKELASGRFKENVLKA